MYKFRENKIEVIGDEAMVYLGKSGAFTIIDTEDIPRIRMFKWQVTGQGKSRKAVYAVAKIGDNVIYLHRLIASFPLCSIDHINRNGLDNRKSNLRPATKIENAQNRGLSSNNKSGYTGVFRLVRDGKVVFRSSIKVNGERKHLGNFKNFKDAVTARRKAEIEFFSFFTSDLPLELVE